MLPANRGANPGGRAPRIPGKPRVMQTVIYLDAETKEAAKGKAAEQNLSLSEYVFRLIDQDLHQ